MGMNSRSLDFSLYTPQLNSVLLFVGLLGHHVKKEKEAVDRELRDVLGRLCPCLILTFTRNGFI